MDIEAVNFLLQELADEAREEVILFQYNEMVQAIMAGYYEAIDEACEFDRCTNTTFDQSGQIFA